MSGRPRGQLSNGCSYQVKDQPKWLVDLIEETVDAVIKHFNGLDFVKAWFARHDKWLDPFDEADQIQIALYILEKFNVFSLEKLFSLAGKAGALPAGDPLRGEPRRMKLPLWPPTCVTWFTGTRMTLVAPIRTRGDQGQLYLNTGTWRARYQKAVRDASFISWKNMTFT